MPLNSPDTSQLARSRLRNFASDSFIVGICKVLEKLRGIVALVFIVKLMGTLEFGVWSQIIAFTGFAAALSEMSLHQALVRHIGAERNENNRASMYMTILLLSLFIGMVATALICFFSNGISNLILCDSAYARYFFAGAFLVPLEAVIQINLNLYRGVNRIKHYSFQSLALSLLEVVAICLYLSFSRSLLGLIWILVAIRSAFSSFQIIHIISFLGFSKPSKIFAKTAVKYCIPLLPSQLSVWIMDRADRFFIGAMLGPMSLGIYSACYNICSLLNLLIVPFSITLLPYVAAGWNQSRELVTQYINFSLKVFLRLALPATLMLTLFSYNIMRIVSNTNIAENSRTIIALVSSGIVIWGVGVIRGMMLHGAKKTIHIGSIRLTTAILNVLLNLWLIPLMGLAGAALATLVSYSVATLLLWLFTKAYFARHIGTAYVLKVVLASVGMGLPLLLLTRPTSSILFLGASALVCVFIYFILLWILGLFDAQEKRLIKKWSSQTLPISFS